MQLIFPLLFLFQSLEHPISPNIAIPLLAIIINNSARHRDGDQLRSVYLKNVRPKYVNTKASAANPKNWYTINDDYLPYVERLYQVYFAIVIPDDSREMIPDILNISDTTYDK